MFYSKYMRLGGLGGVRTSRLWNCVDLSCQTWSLNRILLLGLQVTAIERKHHQIGKHTADFSQLPEEQFLMFCAGLHNCTSDQGQELMAGSWSLIHPEVKVMSE